LTNGETVDIGIAAPGQNHFQISYQTIVNLALFGALPDDRSSIGTGRPTQARP
jgi:hypothetical protein